MEIKMKNASNAMRAKQLLFKRGIRTYVSKKTGNNGCYYYIILFEKDYESAEEILRKEGLL